MKPRETHGVRPTFAHAVHLRESILSFFHSLSRLRLVLRLASFALRTSHVLISSTCTGGDNLEKFQQQQHSTPDLALHEK